MIIARWTLSYAPSQPKLPRQWLSVYVYDTVEEMRAAGEKYDNSEVQTNYPEALGLCQESHMFYREEDVNYEGPVHYSRGGFAGVIRLAEKHLTLEVVLHEVVHAACIVYRRLYDRNVALGDGFESSMVNEERFAYIYGHMAEHMVLALDEIAERV